MASEVAGPTFGAMLRRFRLEANLSQESLAERARMSIDAISALERGTRRTPQRQTVALLINALGIDGAERRTFEAAAARVSTPRRRIDETPSPLPVKRNHNLPYALTSFIGRAKESASLTERLRRERLLSLVGTGGVGKTRLAIELGHAVLDRFADGVWLVELSALRDPALIVPAICAVLGVREEPGVPLIDTLVAAIATTDYLLIIDNCEHFVATLATLVEKLLATSPKLRVVITSREALRILGERVYRVEPLATIETERGESAAVKLFFDRTRAIVDDLPEDEATIAAVRSIVRRLDGLPLAIELAAARVDTVSVRSIADRLEGRLSILEGGLRTALPHHVTLRSLVDWSHDQLDPLEQRLFRRLSVFSGGCTLEAIEAIAADSPLENVDIFAFISALVEKSMVVAESGRDRYRLLDTMRHYAAEQLERSGEHERYVNRHSVYYAELATRVGSMLHGPQQYELMESLGVEIGNIRDALDTLAVSNPGDVRALRALTAMLDYWYVAGSYEEARMYVSAVEERKLPPSPELAMLYAVAALIAISHSAFSDAQRFTDFATAILVETPDPATDIAVRSMALLADVLAGEDIDPTRMAAVHAQVTAADNFVAKGQVLSALGMNAMRAGDVVAATTYFEEAVAVAHQMQSPVYIAAASGVLARMVLFRTDPLRAARLLADAVEPLARRQHLTSLANILDVLVVVAHSTGDHAAAARFLGASRRMHRISGASALSVSAGPIPDDIIAQLRAALGESTYARCVGEGERAFAADVVAAVRAFSRTVGSATTLTS